MNHRSLLVPFAFFLSLSFSSAQEGSIPTFRYYKTVTLNTANLPRPPLAELPPLHTREQSQIFA